MRRFITILLISLITIAFAQENPVAASGGYSKVIKGKEASFEKAVANHVAKWHGPDQWATFAARVMSGPKTGQYFMGSTGHYWKDYAERETTKAHNNDWKNVINKHVEEQGGMMFFEKILDASYNDRSAPMWEGTMYYTKPGGRGTMLNILRKAVEANKKSNYDGSYGVYAIVSGGDQDGLLGLITRMDSMADMAYTGPSVKERWVKAFGEKAWEKDIKDWNSSYTKSTTEINRLIPEMSTPASN